MLTRAREAEEEYRGALLGHIEGYIHAHDSLALLTTATLVAISEQFETIHPVGEGAMKQCINCMLTLEPGETECRKGILFAKGVKLGLCEEDTLFRCKHCAMEFEEGEKTFLATLTIGTSTVYRRMCSESCRDSMIFKSAQAGAPLQPNGKPLLWKREE